MKRYVVCYENKSGFASEDFYVNKSEAIEEINYFWNHLTKNDRENTVLLFCYEIEVGEREMELIDCGELASEDFFVREVKTYL